MPTQKAPFFRLLTLTLLASLILSAGGAFAGPSDSGGGGGEGKDTKKRVEWPSGLLN